MRLYWSKGLLFVIIINNNNNNNNNNNFPTIVKTLLP